MFDLSAVSQSYVTPVHVELPVDGNKTKTIIFKARFKRLNQEQLEDLQRRCSATPMEINDMGVIKEVMVGFEDVLGHDGAQAQFNEENLAALMSVYPVLPTTTKAFFDTVKGAKAKN